MIELRGVEYYRDEDYDSCGNTAHAALEMNAMTILLCSDCLEELIEAVHKFENTIFCHQCNHFKMSDSGFRYGGRCTIDGKEVDTYSMNTCERLDKERISKYGRD